MRTASITFRLTLFFAIASTAVLLAVGYLVGVAVETHFVDLDRVELDGKLELVRHALAKVRSQSDLDAIPQVLDDALVGVRGLSITVFAPDRRILFASSDAVFPAAALKSRLEDASSDSPRLGTWEIGGHGYRDIVAAAPTGIEGGSPATVAIAVNIDHEREFIAALREKLWFAIMLGAAATVLLGWVAARRGLGPVYQLTAVTKRISAKRMHDRLPLDTVPAELKDLAQAFNDMLAGLEDSFGRLSDFSSDLAHEMRTPISNLMTQTEVALSRPRSTDDYREVLYSSLEEYVRLARMISDMLFLAQADHGMILPRNEMVDLAAETKQLFDFFGALAEERGVVLQLFGQGSIRGEKLMIRRAISNLLSNAIRHTTQGGLVQVRITQRESGEVQLMVENPGAQIPPEHLPRLFDRFYRVDPSRQKASDGAGLGLAITKSIVDAHQGSVAATSSGTTTRFEITFPGAVSLEERLSQLRSAQGPGS
jgi:two-component system, OmpR family, heavy metal sensor histidine kinase CusS